MENLLAMSAPWWTFAVRGVLTYVGLLVLLRLAGKRAFGEMSAFDVIVLVLVGGTLRTAIIGADQGFAGPFIGVASVLATDRALAWVSTRWPAFNRLVEGHPALLVVRGRRDPVVMRRECVPDAALDRALHAAGTASEAGVAIGRLEPNGKITFVHDEPHAET